MGFTTNMIEVPGWAILLAGLLCLFFIVRITTLLRRLARTGKRADRWEKQAGIFEEQLIAEALQQLQKADDAGPAATIRTLTEEERSAHEQDGG